MLAAVFDVVHLASGVLLNDVFFNHCRNGDLAGLFPLKADDITIGFAELNAD